MYTAVLILVDVIMTAVNPKPSTEVQVFAHLSSTSEELVLKACQELGERSKEEMAASFTEYMEARNVPFRILLAEAQCVLTPRAIPTGKDANAKPS